ncbi:MAG: IS630 family transposase [Alphaproteobacteria bacterium]|nr:IS630 family transposase [Alphaproteobacteria bacterium]MCB9794815.1 IS630 family transposase [Alphaproteobacteria bacterium]
MHAKKGAPRSPRRDLAEVREARARFRASQGGLLLRRLKFLDETGMTTAMRRRYGYAKRGKKARITGPTYGRRVTVVGVVGLEGPIHMSCFTGALNGERFLEYLRAALPKLSRGDLLVMDNLRVHKVAGVEALLKEYGVTALYLPPYSPDFNIIEIVWSKIKAAIRAGCPSTLERLEAMLTNAWNELKPSELLAMAVHCGYAAP